MIPSIPQLTSAENKTRVSNLGVVVSVRGSVVDIRFDDRLPPIYSVLRAGGKGRIVIEVQAQRDAHHVRGIGLTPTQGLAPLLKPSPMRGSPAVTARAPRR